MRKLRFQKYKNYVYIQEKTFFRWKTLGYWQATFGGSAWNNFYEPRGNEARLLSKVIEDYYKSNELHFNYRLHPSIFINCIS